MRARGGLVSIGSKRGNNVVVSAFRDHPEFLWIRAEAKRRKVTAAEVARDAFRAYRKLVKDAAALPDPPERPGVIKVKF